MTRPGTPPTSGDRPPQPPTTATPTSPTTPTMVVRALALRCPVCGSGSLFGVRRGVMRLGLPDQCPRCALRFDREAGHWTGSWGLNVIVSFTALFVALAVGLALAWPDPPGWGLAVVVVAIAIIVPVVFAPWSATLWLVIDLAFRPLEPGEAPDLQADKSPER